MSSPANKKNPEEQVELPPPNSPEVQGARLGYLVAALPIPDAAKAAFVEMLPQLHPEDVERFARLLDKRFLATATKELDDALVQDIMKLQAQYAAEMKKAEEDLNSAFAAIEKELAATDNT